MLVVSDGSRSAVGHPRGVRVRRVVDGSGRVLTRASGRERGPVFARDEAMLIDTAGKLSFSQFNRAVAYWTQRADAEVGDDGPAPQVPPSEATIGVGLEGEIQLIAHLDPIDGALVDNALDKVMAELARSDRKAGR